MGNTQQPHNTSRRTCPFPLFLQAGLGQATGQARICFCRLGEARPGHRSSQNMFCTLGQARPHAGPSQAIGWTKPGHRSGQNKGSCRRAEFHAAGMRRGHERHWGTSRGQPAATCYIPAPPSKVSRAGPWRMREWGGTLRVSQTLPPMTEPSPMVTRPRMDALE